LRPHYRWQRSEKEGKQGKTQNIRSIHGVRP
jgi:hypothetical protein